LVVAAETFPNIKQILHCGLRYQYYNNVSWHNTPLLCQKQRFLLKQHVGCLKVNDSEANFTGNSAPKTPIRQPGNLNFYLCFATDAYKLAKLIPSLASVSPIFKPAEPTWELGVKSQT